MIHSKHSFAVFFALCLLTTGKCIAEDSPAAWQAGAAKIDITPEQPMWMAGYASRDQPARGTLIPLWAKALAMQDSAGQRGLVLTLDLVGIDRQLSQAICQSLQKEHGLQRAQVLICCSHTHTGPVVGNLRPTHYLQLDADQRALVDQYRLVLKRKIGQVASQALERLAPARFRWGSGRATFAVNRRENRPESDVPAWRTAAKLKGPVDHDVPVLTVQDLAGQLKAVLFGYACHATTLDFYQWSGDYPGFAQRNLERDHPGCIALFWAGCGGDQNPLPRRTVALAEHYGRRLADAVDSVVMTSAMRELAGPLTMNYREIDLPLGTLPSRTELEQNAKSANRYEAARAKMLLRQIDSGQPLSPTYPYPVASWQLGDGVALVALGGEVVVDYALRLKAELAGTRTWVASYSNDVMAYIPSRRVLREGGYEGGGSMVYYGLPTIWAPTIENQIIRQVHAQLQ